MLTLLQHFWALPTDRNTFSVALHRPTCFKVRRMWAGVQSPPPMWGLEQHEEGWSVWLPGEHAEGLARLLTSAREGSLEQAEEAAEVYLHGLLGCRAKSYLIVNHRMDCTHERREAIRAWAQEFATEFDRRLIALGGGQVLRACGGEA